MKIKCDYCGNTYEDTLHQCPDCGAPNPSHKNEKGPRTIEELKERGMWFVRADMDGTPMTSLNMTGSLGLVIGAEGSGVSRLVREKCDMIASIPQKGEINSLNASVAAGVLCYEIFRQRNL